MSDVPTKSLADVQAVILAGGKGTRLQSVVSDRPKALAQIAGRPFIDWMLAGLRRWGINRVVLCSGHMASMLQDYVGDGRKWDMQVIHSPEPEPLGTGGALRYALPSMDSDPVLVLNGDSWCDYDLSSFLGWHLQSQSRVSLLVTWAEDCSRFGTVELNLDSSIYRFVEKAGAHCAGWISTGVYLLDRSLISQIELKTMASLERDFLPSLCGSNLRGFCVRAPFIDIGTSESYEESERFFRRTLPGVAGGDVN